ncbi:MAG: hypothetical protein AAGA48_20325 [Myxococcota bacterium]
MDDDEVASQGTDTETDPLNADSDGDNLSDGEELNNTGTNPALADTDADGLNDDVEVAGPTDPLDSDSDDDDLLDGAEVTLGTDPMVADTDGDGLTDGDEVNVHQTLPLDNDTDDDTLLDGEELNTTNTDPTLADTDGDGLADNVEVAGPTDATVADTDGDGLSDGVEVNDEGTNPIIADTDGDGLSDGAEVNDEGTDPLDDDSDDDTLLDGAEVNTYQTDPNDDDSDDDGLTDDFEVNSPLELDPNNDDTDGDTLLDGDEVNNIGTSPVLADTDGDTINDNIELNSVPPTSPVLADTDGDGLNDAAEIAGATDPTDSDTDGDGLSDGDEATMFGTSPVVADTDGDGLSDGAEVNGNPATNPLVVDTDGDGLSDGAEVNGNPATNPAVADTDGDGLSDGAEVNGNPATNPTLADSDGDGLDDNVELNTTITDPNVADSDGDGLSDGAEVNGTPATNPNLVDTDGDGLNDDVEVAGPTNPAVADTDGDGLSDGAEVNTTLTNPILVDTDGDGVGDGAELSNVPATNPLVADTDGDNLSDGAELAAGTNPTELDTDNDGLNDDVEVNGPTDPLVADTDDDGLSDGDEVIIHLTLPTNSDTDGDGLSDGDEVNGVDGTDPLLADTDGDSINDFDELNVTNTDPTLADTDNDGLDDDVEVAGPTNPNVADTDNDNLNDGDEVTEGTDPLNPDTDGDTLLDGDEVNLYMSDPNLTDTDGDTLDDNEEVLALVPPFPDDGMGNSLFDDTDPNLVDTDGDGLDDDEELALVPPTDPTVADTDGDGLSDGDEVNNLATNPNNSDTDGDGLSDGDEVNVTGTNPSLSDTDGDGLSDGDEVNVHSTSPINNDSDGDLVSDGDEVNLYGSDPLDSTDDGTFDLELQLEDRTGLVTIDDTTGAAGSTQLTQPRDSINPETAGNGKVDVLDGNGNVIGGLWANFTGAGYLDMGLNIDDAFEFDVNAPNADTYTITFRYAIAQSSGTNTRPMDMTVNMGATPILLNFGPTPDWDQWGELSVDVMLNAGVNTIRVENNITTGPNLDRVNVKRDPNRITPVVQPGPRNVLGINFQDGAASVDPDFDVDTFAPFGLRTNGRSYGWVTEASATDADGTTNSPITATYPAVAINERTGAPFDSYDPRLTGYAHFDLPSYPQTGDDGRVAWELATPNGYYEVTAAVGDTGGPNDSANRLFVEGQLATAWQATTEFKSQLVTTVANVQDGFLTLSAQGGTITEIQYLEVRELPDLTPTDGNPAPDDYAEFTTPEAIAGVGSGTTIVSLAVGDGLRPDGVDPSSDLILGVNVVPGRGGVLLASLTDGSIQLFETLTGIAVPFTANTTGGFDALTISPVGNLSENTSYTLLIDGFRDRGDNNNALLPSREFKRFSTSFVTGTAAVIPATPVAFNDTLELNGAVDNAFAFTSVEMSPAGDQLYISTLNGEIKRYDLDATTGALDTASLQTFTPQGDFVVGANRRGIIGLTFDPTDPNTLWITDNYPIPLSGRDNGVPDFSGRLSKVTLGAGGSLTNATVAPYVTGFPRSNGDHVTNSIEFRLNPAFGTPGEPQHLLYVIQGSNTAMGAPDTAWGQRPERLLNAAVLEIDPTLTPPANGFDIATEPLPADGQNRRFTDTDNDLKNGGITIDSGPFNGNFLHFDADGVATVRSGSAANSTLVQSFYDPFAAGAPVRIFAQGQRNAYDLVWHSNGFLYVPTNGSAAGGNVPDNPATATNEAVNGVEKQDDYLFRVVAGDYYGHPNPLRDRFILNGGNPTANVDPNEVTSYAVGILPEADYDLTGSYSVNENRSPNGAIEYTSNAFGSSLQGAVLFVEYSGGNDVRAVTLFGDGTVDQDFVLGRPDGTTINNYPDPLDVTQDASGRLYVATLNRGNGQSQLIRFDPAPGQTPTDTSADEDGNLALTVVDALTPAAVVFGLNGVDADIVSVSSSVDSGAAQAVTLDANDQFTLDLSSVTGTATVDVTVTDDDANTATVTVMVTPGTNPTPSALFIDAVASEWVILDTDDGSIKRIISDPTTHESTTANDANGDGLNDNYDGQGYIDVNGGAEPKATVDINVATAGQYDIAFRLANGSNNNRPMTFTLGSQTQTIADTKSGDFTTWQDFTIPLDLTAGSNVVTITQDTGAGGPNFDSLTATFVAPSSSAPNSGTQMVNGIQNTFWEEDLATLSGGAIVGTAARNQSGTGYIDFVDTPNVVDPDQTVEWTVSVPTAGTYNAAIIYALAVSKGARPMALEVNGVGQGTLPFVGQSNANEDDWFPETFQVALNAGINTIAVTAPGGAGPNVDFLRIEDTPVPQFPTNPDADIEIESLDPGFYSNRLHFSFLVNNSASANNRSFKDTATVRISNSGTVNLDFFDATIAGFFTLQNPTAFQNLTLAPGASLDVVVVFDGNAVPPRSNNQNGVVNGTLTLTTNDAEDQLSVIDLSGFWQARDEGGQEPNLNEVWEVMGFSTRVVGLPFGGGGGNSILDFWDVYLPYDLNDPTEVLEPVWQIAPGVTQARMTQIAAFHGPGGSNMGIHEPGDKGDDDRFWNHDGSHNQRIMPLQGNGDFCTELFDNAQIPDAWTGPDTFSFEVSGLSTNPTLNPTGAGAPSQADLNNRYPGYTVTNGNVSDPQGNAVPDGYTVRMFQAKDPAGNPIPNTYLGVMDFTGINYDYNDNMFLVTGVTPAP